MDLRQNMQAAWQRRRDDAVRRIEAIRKAPAFFKPEFIERAVTDYRRAEAEIARWSA